MESQLQFLFQAAYSTLKENPELSRHYIKLFNNLAIANDIKIAKSEKRKTCGYCNSIFIPGINCFVRIRRRLENRKNKDVVEKLIEIENDSVQQQQLQYVSERLKKCHQPLKKHTKRFLVNKVFFTCKICYTSTVISGSTLNHLKELDSRIKLDIFEKNEISDSYNDINTETKLEFGKNKQKDIQLGTVNTTVQPKKKKKKEKNNLKNMLEKSKKNLEDNNGFSISDFMKTL